MNAATRLLARIYRHRLWRAACVALSILLLTSTAFAAQPLTGTFKGKVIGTYVTFTNPSNKRVVTDWSGVLNLQLDRDTPGDGLGPLVPVFCIEVNVLVRGGDRYQSDGSVTALLGGCQIRYLLDRYPASTATNADEAAARQLAIWHFSDNIDLTTVQEPAIQARAIALADEAALAIALSGCPATQATVASLTLTPPTASVVAGQIVNYTVTADPPGAAQSVDITISGSATLQNGQQQATLPLIQGVATFSVINPVAGTSTITARLPYVLDAGTVFSPINAGRPTQRLVMADRISLSASATVQASWGAATATPTTLPATATPTGIPPTATPSTAGSPTTTPITGGAPTATPSTAGSPTTTPITGGAPTATPSTAGSPTTTPITGGAPTTTPPVPATPGNAPPVSDTNPQTIGWVESIAYARFPNHAGKYPAKWFCQPTRRHTGDRRHRDNRNSRADANWRQRKRRSRRQWRSRRRGQWRAGRGRRHRWHRSATPKPAAEHRRHLQRYADGDHDSGAADLGRRVAADTSAAANLKQVGHLP